MTVVVKVENVSKKYRLGTTGTNSLKGDFQRWWALKRGKEDPLSKVMEESQMKEGDFWALRDINFEIRQGEAVGIIGKNGAGKSTLLKLLSRITLPTTGGIKIKGRIASLLEVGTGFNPELSGRENVYLNGAILGMSKAEVARKFDEIVDFSGVERFIDTPVKRYSSGMYVRLAFAVAAHLESEILILDEVLAVGDAEFQKKCLNKMDDIVHKQGRTVFFVSHSMSSILDLCNRVLLLQKGNCIGAGETEDIIAKYISANNKNEARHTFTTSIENNENQVLIITKAIIHNDKKERKTEFLIKERIFIEIEIEVKQDNSGYNIGFELEHVQYGVIFTTTKTDISHERWDAVFWEKGFHNFKIELPSSLLREGEYYINISAAIPNIKLLDKVERAVSFKIFDFHSPVAKSGEGRRGTILPILAWEKV